MTSLRVRVRAPPTTEVCPSCQSRMTVFQVMPISFTDGFESVTYKCTQCRSELKRTFHPPGSEPAPYSDPRGGLWRRGGFERVR
jgi:transposase-like protein